MRVLTSFRLHTWHALTALIVFNLFFAFIVGDQYGQTWDEPSFYLYGERSFDAYQRGIANQPLIPEKHIFFLDLRYYGPFYTAIGWKVVDSLGQVLSDWGYYDVWHFVNFIFFQIALISLYWLAKRFMHPWMAFFVVVLFNTQPLIFGHAFINPKDIPFLVFFMASVVLGLYMVDSIGTMKIDEETSTNFPCFQIYLAILFALFVFTFVSKDLISFLIGRVISFMYNAPDGSLLDGIFSLLVRNPNRLPVESYIYKAVAAHLERTLIYLIFLVLIGRKLYLSRSGTDRFVFLPRIDVCSWSLVLTAGIMLGLATSIRLLAPFAGLLIVGYALMVRGKRSYPSLFYYFSIAAVVSFWTWPFLWDSPSLHFFEAVQVMRDFPYTAEVRFMGDNIAPSSLPWYYISFLVAVQLTEPVVALAVIGIGIVTIASSRIRSKDSYVMLLWFFLPVGLQILLGSNVYDNFRQFLFVLPPLFILAGIGLDALISRIPQLFVKFLLLALCVLPGLVGVVSLHPYQYIYYNSFVGGLPGVEVDYELDYWLTSYREAGSYINQVASTDANILAWGSGYNGARPDLTIYSFSFDEDIATTGETFEYAVITTRFFRHSGVLKDAPVVYEVRRRGVLLAVVKKLAAP